MKYLAFFTLILGMSTLPACTEKSNESSTETTGSTGTTDDSTTATSDTDTTTSTTTGDTEPTSGSETGETTGTSSGTTTMPLDEDCAFLIGKKFVSKKQWPCGPPRDPEEPGPLCPDEVSFDAESNFFYQSGDFGLGGTYTCAAGVIKGEADGETYEGTIDAATGQLVWEGDEFEVE